ncbi:uncharacterized protein SCHCODRAFT_02706230 [Schizophyllum commune H4-8]|uniref:uncharacterized protein n=1 Tax=Schizophyllum commune (strain H4-8 / FGSC 9210) TaxID=578458 RepID=UPI00216069AA|nr:uncharacterized protein SCHCODRAFT_02706230 [Schizophyllum commune H4-8]KAI5885766.1 hypothetical protein SCHCODRAFT_02706230 [Schizophyllum commune H4-8]
MGMPKGAGTERRPGSSAFAGPDNRVVGFQPTDRSARLRLRSLCNKQRRLASNDNDQSPLGREEEESGCVNMPRACLSLIYHEKKTRKLREGEKRRANEARAPPSSPSDHDQGRGELI